MTALFALFAFFAANFLAASSGAIFKPGDWYAGLNKPGWTPPNWAFPVVWTTLFSMNAVAGWLVWRDAGPSAGVAWVAYGGGLVVNAMWSALFFGRRRMDLALVDNVALWLAVLAQIALFAPISPAAALLGVPYLLWVSLAGVLNWRMITLNRAVPTA